MRQKLTTLIELVGMALVALGAGLLLPAAGLIVLGVQLVLIGYLAGRA